MSDLKERAELWFDVCSLLLRTPTSDRVRTYYSEWGDFLSADFLTWWPQVESKFSFAEPKVWELDMPRRSDCIYLEVPIENVETSMLGDIRPLIRNCRVGAAPKITSKGILECPYRVTKYLPPDSVARAKANVIAYSVISDFRSAATEDQAARLRARLLDQPSQLVRNHATKLGLEYPAHDLKKTIKRMLEPVEATYFPRVRVGKFPLAPQKRGGNA